MTALYSIPNEHQNLLKADPNGHLLQGSTDGEYSEIGGP
jgi:hypothetical protein